MSHTQNATANTTQSAERTAAQVMLDISAAVDEIREDWLYQLCGQKGRDQLLLERVPTMANLRVYPPVVLH